MPRKFFIITILSLLLLSGCALGKRAQPEPELLVVTTIPPLYSLTSLLTEGTTTRVENLIPASASVHEFQLTTKAARLLADADLVVINGLGLEDFLGDVLDESSARVVDTSKDVVPLALVDSHEDHEYDGHTWLDPTRAVVQVSNIATALSAADPANADIYAANGIALSASLYSLDEEIRAQFSALKIEPYIVFHNAYLYFQNAYGISPAEVFEEFPGKEPSALHMKELVDAIVMHGVRVIFVEPQFSSEAVLPLAQEYSVRLLTLDPYGPVMRNGYFEMMRDNLAAFEEAFTP